MEKLTAGELSRLSSAAKAGIEDDLLSSHAELAAEMLGALDAGTQGLAESDRIRAVRTVGDGPLGGGDPLNAIVTRCHVRATVPRGSLVGKRIAVKDAIAVAGVPLTCGASVLKGFVPTEDSTISDRIVREGGEIVAMTNMDCFGCSAGGESSVYGATLNPHDRTRSAGGSSGGSAAGLFYEGIDIAVGTDQGGSLRVPASWCGVLGLKPTHGLVPYTRAVGLSEGYDHAGPLARDVAALALLLEAIAGPDGRDARQCGVKTRDYRGAVDEAPEDLDGTRIGLLVEGFSSRLGVQPETTAAVKEAARRLDLLGATVECVSVPMHLSTSGIALPMYVEGLVALLTTGGAVGQSDGFAWPELGRAVLEGMPKYGRALSPQVKVMLAIGLHLRQIGVGRFCAEARIRQAQVHDAYQRAFREVDFLAMPTTPWPAHVVDARTDTYGRARRGRTVMSNTVQFNISGHPALSMPAAEVAHLPVGVMIVGRPFSDDRLLALARTYERAYGWLPKPSRRAGARW